MDVAHPLRKALGLPVYIEKDVNLLLLYDIHHLHLDPSKSILGFYVGTGFGNALYLNGDFYTGKNGATGELGHIPLYGLDKRCNCGNLGCAGDHLFRHGPECHCRPALSRRGILQALCQSRGKRGFAAVCGYIGNPHCHRADPSRP